MTVAHLGQGDRQCVENSFHALLKRFGLFMGWKGTVKVKIDFLVLAFILAVLEAKEWFLDEQRPHFVP